MRTMYRLGARILNKMSRSRVSCFRQCMVGVHDAAARDHHEGIFYNQRVGVAGRGGVAAPVDVSSLEIAF